MRLTIKCNNEIGYGYKEYSSEGSVAVTRKLGQLEDIEEELGIDLVILLKAVRDGVWCKHPFSIDYEPFRIDYGIDYESGEEYMFICGMEIKNYGKTWALTKEELL